MENYDIGQNEDNQNSPSISFSVNPQTNKVVLYHSNLSSVTVNYYKMDIELLFSTSPFVQQV
jgi:hypothetical protein